jgi:hypothetical protein
MAELRMTSGEPAALNRASRRVGKSHRAAESSDEFDQAAPLRGVGPGVSARARLVESSLSTDFACISMGADFIIYLA